ncbi:MAG: RHS repeat protein, partial [Burkholderiales bacterium]|nr:RHS repeat protein [Burkholderiales bacterium]
MSRFKFFLLIFILLVIPNIALPKSIEFPPFFPPAPAPSDTPFYSELTSRNNSACSLLPLGGFGIDSDNITHVLVNSCFDGAELEPFLSRKWTGNGNCIPSDTTQFTREDLCNGSAAVILIKPPECPVGYVRGASDMCMQNGRIVPDKNREPDNCVGNPVNAGTGIKFHFETDVNATPQTELQIKRTYSSLKIDHDINKASNKHWQFNYERKIFVKKWQEEITTAVALRPSGKSTYFTLIGDLWVADSDINDHLSKIKENDVSIGWRYYDAANDSIEIYDTSGRLQSITNRDGRTQALTYDTSNNLVAVTDDIGRVLHFSYDSSNRIDTVTDPAGHLYRYAYDDRDNLTSVTYPDGKVRTYYYNEPAYTSGADLPHALTGITDENGVRYATYTYDAQGRAIVTEHAGGA